MIRPARTRRPNIKSFVEKHRDGYVAYPLDLKGVVVDEGDTYDEALADVNSAIRVHVKPFGPQVFCGRDNARFVHRSVA
jgi:hypothetical protein